MKMLYKFSPWLIIPSFLIGCTAIQADIEKYNKQIAILSEQAKLPKEEKSKAVAWTTAVATWDKLAFSRAQKRLNKVHRGMREDVFIKQMKMQTLLDKNKQPIAVCGDGWLYPLDLYIKTANLYRNEYVFGFVENGIVREQVVVVCENGEVVDIAELLYVAPKDTQREEIKSVPISHSWSKEAFSFALERMKGLKVGIDRWQMHRIMKGNWAELEPGRLYFICDGYLHNSYKSENTPQGLKQELFFGYRENEQDYPKFVIVLLNGKISEIRRLDTTTGDSASLLIESKSIEDKINELRNLYLTGNISQEEYEASKMELIKAQKRRAPE